MVLLFINQFCDNKVFAKLKTGGPETLLPLLLLGGGQTHVI